MEKAGRPEKLTDELKREITRIRMTQKRWKAPAIQKELRLWLVQRIKEETTGRKVPLSNELMDVQVEDRLPGISSIQKYLKDTIPSQYKELPEDKPWTLESLKDKSIPPEALPAVLEVWLRTRTELTHFTVREALWVARIYPLFTIKIEKCETTYDIDNLKRVAKFYANEELLTEVAKTSFFEFGGTRGILNLYEEWKRTRFEPAVRSQLLLPPIVVGQYPKDKSLAQQLHRTAELQGEGLRDNRERFELEKKFLREGKEWPSDVAEQDKLVKEHRKELKQNRQQTGDSN
jgi:hypothetical protein